MNRETVRALCQLNTEFYERNAASFSQTRTGSLGGLAQVHGGVRV